jgi:hypothetical protein
MQSPRPVNSAVMRLLMTLTFAILATVTFAANAPSIAAQTKFDSYGRLVTDDEAAHLDLFDEQLRNHPNTRGYLVGYNDPSVPPGVFLRRLYGDQQYLTEIRGLEPNRLSVIDGGYRDRFTIEMWIAPLNSMPPSPAPNATHVFEPTQRFLFDKECLECQPVVFLDLPGLGAGIKFYAAALHDASRSLIVVRPGQETSSVRALADARRAKRKLTRQYGIASNRIAIRLAHRRKDNMAIAEMWVIPRAAK